VKNSEFRTGGEIAAKSKGEQMFGDSESSLRYASDVSAAELAAAQEYLKSYRYGCRMLACADYAHNYLVRDVDVFDEEQAKCDEALLRARMYGVRAFINNLKCDSNSKLLLYWHYIRGESVARCADIIGVSRAGAFRVRHRALEAAARALRKSSAPRGIEDILPK
jgi:hypothetical protein